MRSKGQGHWERKCKNRFSHISSSKVDRFISNHQDQNDHRPILHTSPFVKYISPVKCFISSVVNWKVNPCLLFTLVLTKVGTPVICVNNLLSLPSFINIYSNRHRYQFVWNNLQLKQSVCNWLKWHLTAQYQTTQIQTYQHQPRTSSYVTWICQLTTEIYIPPTYRISSQFLAVHVGMYFQQNPSTAAPSIRQTVPEAFNSNVLSKLE